MVFAVLAAFFATQKHNGPLNHCTGISHKGVGRHYKPF
jgi:hypothetical protein